MNPQMFFEHLKENPRPVVVDFWAPWCAPCRAIKPNLEKLAQEYAGQVDLWEINADESQELLRQLRVYGIPTLIGYRKDEEKVRYVGAKPQSQLKSLFEALSNGTVPASHGLSGWDRFLRFLAGSVLAGIGWTNQYSWFLLVVGGILMFSAVYDRCPIWKAITTQFKKVMAK
jgi:thioredoxin 1